MAEDTSLVKDEISGIEIPEQFEVVDFVVRNPEEFIPDPIKNLHDEEVFNYMTIFIIKANELQVSQSRRSCLLNDLIEHQNWATIGKHNSMFVPLFIADDEIELRKISVAALPFSFVLTKEGLFYRNGLHTSDSLY